MCVGHDHNSWEIENQGHRSQIRVSKDVTWSVTPSSLIEGRFSSYWTIITDHYCSSTVCGRWGQPLKAIVIAEIVTVIHAGPERILWRDSSGPWAEGLEFCCCGNLPAADCGLTHPSFHLHHCTCTYTILPCYLCPTVILSLSLPSVLWHCWLGGRKGIQPVKKTERWGAGVFICLERGADLHMAQLIPLPLTVSCFSRIQTGFYLSGTGSPR